MAFRSASRWRSGLGSSLARIHSSLGDYLVGHAGPAARIRAEARAMPTGPPGPGPCRRRRFCSRRRVSRQISGASSFGRGPQRPCHGALVGPGRPGAGPTRICRSGLNAISSPAVPQAAAPGHDRYSASSIFVARAHCSWRHTWSPRTADERHSAPDRRA